MDYDKIAIIKDVVEKGKSKRAAAIKLSKSIKTINRIIKKYQKLGEEGLIHGNRGRTPANKLDHDLIFNHYKETYEDFNMLHFSEKKNFLILKKSQSDMIFLQPLIAMRSILLQ